MTDLEKKIAKLKALLGRTLFFLNGMNSQNFDINLSEAQNSMQNAHLLKHEIMSGNSIDELRIFETDLAKIAKQISDKFDNIISEKRIELGIIAKKLKLVQNQKKLLNYSR